MYHSDLRDDQSQRAIPTLETVNSVTLKAKFAPEIIICTGLSDSVLKRISARCNCGFGKELIRTTLKLWPPFSCAFTPSAPRSTFRSKPISKQLRASSCCGGEMSWPPH